jgi:RNA polymerase sigma-70 factor (ECF subfamily)
MFSGAVTPVTDGPQRHAWRTAAQVDWRSPVVTASIAHPRSVMRDKNDPGSATPGGVELKLEALGRSGDLNALATLAVETYGAELFGYLVSVMGSEADASEVFSQVAEDLWRGLPTFRFRCSIRTWLYVLARHAAARFRRAPWNQGQRRRAADQQLEALVAHTRTLTQPWLRTDVKNRWSALRESLDPEDRSLLVLRVDCQLEWKEIARVTLGEESPDAAALTRESDRLKKRFQLLKEDLRRRARAAGLLDDI